MLTFSKLFVYSNKILIIMERERRVRRKEFILNTLYSHTSVMRRSEKLISA